MLYGFLTPISTLQVTNYINDTQLEQYELQRDALIKQSPFLSFSFLAVKHYFYLTTLHITPLGLMMHYEHS